MQINLKQSSPLMAQAREFVFNNPDFTPVSIENDEERFASFLNARDFADDLYVACWYAAYGYDVAAFVAQKQGHTLTGLERSSVYSAVLARLGIELAAGRVFVVGQRVIYKIDKNEWYVGTVMKVTPTKVFVQYDDGFMSKTGTPKSDKDLFHYTGGTAKKKKPLADADAKLLKSTKEVVTLPKKVAPAKKVAPVAVKPLKTAPVKAPTPPAKAVDPVEKMRTPEMVKAEEALIRLMAESDYVEYFQGEDTLQLKGMARKGLVNTTDDSNRKGVCGTMPLLRALKAGTSKLATDYGYWSFTQLLNYKGKPKPEDRPKPYAPMAGCMVQIKYRDGPKWKYAEKVTPGAVYVGQGGSLKDKPIARRHVIDWRWASEAEKKQSTERWTQKTEKVNTVREKSMVLVNYSNSRAWEYCYRVNLSKGTFSVAGGGAKMRDLPLNLAAECRDATPEEHKSAEYRLERMNNRKESFGPRRSRGSDPYDLALRALGLR